jgi:hypothetical protein
MPDMISPDLTNAPAPAAATPATPGATGSEPVKQGGNQDAAFRRLSQKLQAGEAEIHELRERLARVEGAQSGPAPTSSPQKASTGRWEDLSDQQLDQAISIGVTDSNPAALTAAINEKVSRAAAKAAEAARGVGSREYQQAKYADTVKAKIQTEFGQDAINPDSPLFQAADRYFSQEIQRLGKDRVLSDPSFQYNAFLKADRELHVGERDRLVEAQREVDRLKRQMALEHGGVHPGVPRSQESADALAKGDLNGAIRGLGLFKSVQADVKKRYS